MTNYYALLGIGIHATVDRIKSAYRRKAREVHPDSGHPGTQAFHQLQAAYAVLSEPAKRADYDRQLQRWAAHLGHILCDGCGVANRTPRIPDGFQPTCGRCGTRLRVNETQRRASARAAVTYQVVSLVEDVGSEVLAMARDAAVEGLDRLRSKFGIPKHGRRS